MRTIVIFLIGLLIANEIMNVYKAIDKQTEAIKSQTATAESVKALEEKVERLARALIAKN